LRGCREYEGISHIKCPCCGCELVVVKKVVVDKIKEVLKKAKDK
jgi:hypothetical protein